MKITGSIYIIACVSGLLYTCNIPIKKEEDNTAVEEFHNKEVIDSLKSEASFIVNAYDKSMFVMKASSLAKGNANDEQVKLLAQSLMIEHSKVSAKLSALANEKNIAIPDSLSSPLNQEYLKLTDLKGDFFDQEFMDLVVADHEDLVSEFERMAANAADENIKQFAANILTTLHIHYNEAIDLKTKVDRMSRK